MEFDSNESQETIIILMLFKFLFTHQFIPKKYVYTENILISLHIRRNRSETSVCNEDIRYCIKVDRF